MDLVSVHLHRPWSWSSTDRDSM